MAYDIGKVPSRKEALKASKNMTSERYTLNFMGKNSAMTTPQKILLMAGVIVIAFGAYSVYHGKDTGTPTTNVTKKPQPTQDDVYKKIKPTETTPKITQEPIDTPTPVERYVDASRGGTYRTGDKISYLNVEGEVSAGEIVNGKVESFLILTDENNQTVLIHQKGRTNDYDKVELISYPQDDYALLKIDGVDSGCVFPFSEALNINDYLELLGDKDYCN